MTNNQGSAYADVVRINDRLIEAYNAIALETSIQNEEKVSAALRKESLVVRDTFRMHGALTSERALRLDEVGGELVRAGVAAKAGDRMETWSALMRAHGHINSVISDFMTKQE